MKVMLITISIYCRRLDVFGSWAKILDCCVLGRLELNLVSSRTDVFLPLHSLPLTSESDLAAVFFLFIFLLQPSGLDHDYLARPEIEMALRPQFLLFGDSITEQSFRPGGWGAALANTYSRKADVIVRGYGGYNTRWALFLLNYLFPKSCQAPPTAVTVFFGANDAALPGRTSERQNVPLEEFEENLKKIVKHLKECSPGMLVVLITPPPVDEDGRMQFARSLYGEKAMKIAERTNEITGLYAKQCVEIAKELQIPCIDLWSKMQETAGWQKDFLSDGLHLTQAGNAVVHSEVVRVLNEASLRAEDMSYDFPHHSKIDGARPEMAFQDLKQSS